MKNIFKRIGKKISIKKLSILVCKLYNLDEYTGYKIIKVGCDDFSYSLKTKTNKYVVKILNQRKCQKDIERFEEIYQIYMRNKIKCPYLLKNINGDYMSNIQFENININLCLLEYIDGKDLYSINKKINKHDINKIVELLVSIHTIKEGYEIEYDKYSFMKLEEVFEEYKSNLPKIILKDIHKFLEIYSKVDFSKLPVCFIHADLGSGNIIKNKDNELFMIDFIQSGTGIRLLDIVIIINRCIFNYKYIKHSKKMEKYFLQRYQEYIKLTDYELKILPVLEKANAYSFAILEYSKMDSKQKRVQYKNDLSFIKNITI